MAHSKTYGLHSRAAIFGRVTALLIAVGLITACGVAANDSSGSGGTPNGTGSPSTGPARPSALPAKAPFTVLRQIAVPGQAWGLVAGERALFALSADGSGTTIVRIDQATGHAGPSIREANVAGTAIAGGLLWVVRHASSVHAKPAAVLGLSPLTLRTERTVALPDRPARGASDAAAAGGLVWIAGTRLLMGIDPATGSLVKTVNLGTELRSSGWTAVASDPAGTSLWTSEGSGGGGPIAVQRRDARTGAVLGAVNAPVAGLGAARITADPDHAWLAYATGMEGSYFRATVAGSHLRETQPRRARTARETFSNGLKTFLAGQTLWIVDGNSISCAADATGRILSQVSGPKALFSDLASQPNGRLALAFNGDVLIVRPKSPCA